MMNKKQKSISINGWKEFYDYLLKEGVATVEILQRKYDEYEKHAHSLSFRPDWQSISNGQSALREILFEKEQYIEEAYER